MSRFRLRAAALGLALGVALAPAVVDAKAGGGFSFGSRGARTYSAPPVTSTAPRSATPFERSATPQSAPGAFNQARPGFFGSSLGRGLMGGLLGAGLFGLLSGGGFFGGLGGLTSILGLLLQIGVIVLLIRLAMTWFRNRQTPAMAGGYARQSSGAGLQPTGLGGGMFSGGANAPRSGFGSPAAPATTPLNVDAEDFNVFERRLADIQAAYSAEDRSALHRLATPEMASYFEGQLADSARQGVVNRLSDVKLEQGDLSEAWSEASDDYATVAMRFSLIDTMVDRATGRLVSGDAQKPSETTEIWTFRRPRGAAPQAWALSGIQQA